MTPTPSQHRHRRGMLLMEVLIAIVIFGTAALSLVRYLSASAQLAIVSQLDMRMLLRLQSTLTRYSKTPQIKEESNIQDDPDELGVYTVTNITKLEGLKNTEGQELTDMFHITVSAFYQTDSGQKGEAKAQTYRYARLYSVSGGNAGQVAPAQ